MEMNFVNHENKLRAMKIASNLLVLVLFVAVSATLLNNVVATPASPRE
jgi:hypothetical protein